MKLSCMSMPTPSATIEYMKLSVSERIQLVEDIWDNIATEASYTVELSPLYLTSSSEMNMP